MGGNSGGNNHMGKNSRLKEKEREIVIRERKNAWERIAN
jgi:hypothetical protein